MHEVGIELSDELPPALAKLPSTDYDMMIVLRSRDGTVHPTLQGVTEVLIWSFGPLEDAETVGLGDRLAATRRMRDELRTRVGFLVSTRARDS